MLRRFRSATIRFRVPTRGPRPQGNEGRRKGADLIHTQGRPRSNPREGKRPEATSPRAVTDQRQAGPRRAACKSRWQDARWLPPPARKPAPIRVRVQRSGQQPDRSAASSALSRILALEFGIHARGRHGNDCERFASAMSFRPPASRASAMRFRLPSMRSSTSAIRPPLVPVIPDLSPVAFGRPQLPESASGNG